MNDSQVRTYARHVPEAISYENQYVAPQIIEEPVGGTLFLLNLARPRCEKESMCPGLAGGAGAGGSCRSR